MIWNDKVVYKVCVWVILGIIWGKEKEALIIWPISAVSQNVFDHFIDTFLSLAALLRNSSLSKLIFRASMGAICTFLVWSLKEFKQN